MGIREQSLERDVQRAVLDLLAAERIYAVRINTGTGWVNGRPIKSHSGGAGLADILAFPTMLERYDCGFNHGTLVPLWIEIKSATGIQTPEQVGFQTFVEAQGHAYLLARSSDDVIRWLKEHR